MLFDYLYLKDNLSTSEAIMGFGHFDKKIPLHCGTLYTEGYAPYIIFCGGRGAGSAGLKKSEAHEFLERLQLHFPGIPSEKVILEDQSTNTGENIRFTFSLLEKNYPDILPPGRIKKLILVANAYRQRRVWLTCRKWLGNIELINNPPVTDFENEMKMFENAGEDLCIHLVNELDRIKVYPGKGFIEQSEIPININLISEKLKMLL